jgi:hypothetical protein
MKIKLFTICLLLVTSQVFSSDSRDNLTNIKLTCWTKLYPNAEKNFLIIDFISDKKFKIHNYDFHRWAGYSSVEIYEGIYNTNLSVVKFKTYIQFTRYKRNPNGYFTIPIKKISKISHRVHLKSINRKTLKVNFEIPRNKSCMLKKYTGSKNKLTKRLVEILKNHDDALQNYERQNEEKQRKGNKI